MFDRIYSRGIPNGGGPAVYTVPLALPANEAKRLLSMWVSLSLASNVHLLDGAYDLGRAQQTLQAGPEGILLTAGGRAAERLLPDDVQEITVFFETANASNQFQICQFRIRDHHL